jgi:hypothetical protein
MIKRVHVNYKVDDNQDIDLESLTVIDDESYDNSFDDDYDGFTNNSVSPSFIFNDEIDEE